MKNIILVFAAFLLYLVLPSGVVSAANVFVAGLTVSPAIQQINLAKGQTDYSFNVQVANNNNVPITVSLSAKDFTALNTSGQVAFYNNAPAGNVHGLAKWIEPAVPQFDLSPGENKTIPISIVNAGTLAPGGHYGAIIYHVVPKGSSSKGYSISSNEEISTLVFLTTEGGGIQSVKLDNPSLSSLLFNIPNTVDLVLTNAGNTQTAPRGVVTITNSSNKEIARGIINIDSGLVLPGTSRLYAVAVRNETNIIYPGLYHIHISYRADTNTTSQTYSKNFLLINEQIVIGVSIVLLLVIILLIRIFKPYKIYTRK